LIPSHTSIRFAVVVAAMLAIAHGDGHAALPGGLSRTDRQVSSADIQVAVEVEKKTYRSGQDPSFTISLRNSGSQNLLLNGGELLGNGQEIWSSLKCEFRDSGERRVPLAMHWGVSHVGGRIYFLGVPLRAGSLYTIAVTPRDYYLGKGGQHLEAGVYVLACTHSGAQSTFRDATQLPKCWEGVATSNAARVEIIAAER
jgi:hypothetical protein